MKIELYHGDTPRVIGTCSGISIPEVGTCSVVALIAAVGTCSGLSLPTVGSCSGATVTAASKFAAKAPLVAF